jgi:hypothetical protein
LPVRKEYRVEFEEQAVRFVFEEIGADESRLAAVERLAPKLKVRPATLMSWVKAAPRLRRSQSETGPRPVRATSAAGPIERSVRRNATSAMSALARRAS